MVGLVGYILTDLFYQVRKTFSVVCGAEAVMKTSGRRSICNIAELGRVFLE